MAIYWVVQTANLSMHNTLYTKWAYNQNLKKKEFDKKKKNAVFFSKKQNNSGKNRMVGSSVQGISFIQFEGKNLSDYTLNRGNRFGKEIYAN